MDAFAVALTQGARFRPAIGGGATIALTFGVFQGIMPLIGWGIGALAMAYVAAIDHWIAFGLLTFLGLRMLRGDVGEEEAARALAVEGLLEIMQKGHVVHPLTFKGPIRLRLAATSGNISG